ncbi:hypothetical protein BH10PSE7_BH10PSE7_39050 [soil metagenome]
MASSSLKIVNEGVADPVDQINHQGYIEVVEQAILDPDGFEDFCQEDDNGGFTRARTKLLIAWANSHGGRLKQLDHTGSPVNVTKDNCRIRARADVRAESGTFSKITISVPEEQIAVGDLVYVDHYISKFLDIYRNGTTLPAPTSTASARNARKFMFGVMMLTKCR